jgi:nucleoside-diphosphate-sugar epimerase
VRASTRHDRVPDLTRRILVLGAAGRLGRAAAEAFRDAGWSVTSFVRPGAEKRAARRTKVVESEDRAALTEAARGADVLLHALNTPYPQWNRLALPHLYAAIDAAEATGATLMFPGNVYNYGAAMPEVLDETTPMLPTTRKGILRETMEQRLREAADRGVRAIVVRAGDFFGGGRGAWFDLVIARDIAHGRITYPGPLNTSHAWAYLPDLAATMVRIAERRADLGAFATFGFPGHTVTGHELAAAIAQATGHEIGIERMRWWLVRSIGRLMPMGRELAELEYLWRVPHRVSGEKLEALIDHIPHTPLAEAVAASLRELGIPHDDR